MFGALCLTDCRFASSAPYQLQPPPWVTMVLTSLIDFRTRVHQSVLINEEDEDEYLCCESINVTEIEEADEGDEDVPGCDETDQP